MTTSENTVRQVSGYYRQRVGQFLVTALYDGYINLAPSLFHGLGADEMQKLIDRKCQPQTADGVPTAVTTYLIDTGTTLILLNAGGAKAMGDTMGGLLDSLRAAGYSREDISAVLLTHLHFDHVCGLIQPSGSVAFPKAKVYVSEPEAEFWLDSKIAQAAPEASRPFFEMAAKALALYVHKGDLRTFRGEAEVLPGITAIPSPGHTAGHSSFLLTSGSEQLLLWGDIVHSHALQFDHPEISNDFDSDQAQAVDTRRKLFKKVVQEKWLIAGDHLPFPGFGHMTAEGEKYSWVPVEYAALP